MENVIVLKVEPVVLLIEVDGLPVTCDTESLCLKRQYLYFCVS